MRLYISSGSSKRITISSTGEGCFWDLMKVKGSNRLLSFRSVLYIIFIVGVLLPFLFITVAFLALEGASKCSAMNCLRLRLGPAFFGGSDTSLRLGDEITRRFLEAKEEAKGVDSSLESFNELVAHVSSNRRDIKIFASTAAAMLLKMERRVQSAKVQGLMYKQLASMGIPKSMHCLSLRLANEYSINALARAPLLPPEHTYRLSDASYYHIVLLTDNVPAASVVVNSSVRSSRQPEKMVFHILTDRKTYAPMHAMFVLNPVRPASVEVKGLHHYDWPIQMSTRLMEIMKFHEIIREHYYYDGGGGYERLEALRPKHLSPLNYLKIHLPELFPELEKIVFLDDDVVIQNDLSPLWAMHLEGKVNAAVSSLDVDSGKNGCAGGRYKDHLNFSNPLISSQFDHDRCAWMYGMNIFDLQAWRRSNITNTYHHWLKLNMELGFKLWGLGELPPALVAFHGQVHQIDSSWHVPLMGMGSPLSATEQKMVGDAAVIHFNGPAKPWLQIGPQELQRLWTLHINFSNEFVRSCCILG